MLKSPARSLLVVVAGILSLAFACRGGGPAADIRAERVVLVSYDAVGADLARQWIDDGVAASPAGLAGMAANGISAERLRMIDPTLTAAQHIALASGRDAAATGVVSNSYRIVGTPIDEWVSGFTASSEVDPLWVSARKQGLRVATLMWPGADGRAPERKGDFGAVWPGPPVSPSQLLELAPETAETTGEVPSNDGLAPLVWRLQIDLGRSSPTTVEALIALVDADPNGVPRYDAVAVRLADTDVWSYAGEMEWLELGFEAQGPDDTRPRPYGAWCKVLHIDRLTGHLRFYRGGANRLTGYPQEFEDRLAEAIGPWPGEADHMVQDWWLDLAEGVDLDTFVEQGERLDRYLDRMAEWVLAEEEADLFLVYHSSIDVYQHASLITDELQWAYSPGRALAAREGLKRMGRSVDASVAATWRALDPERDVLVVVSDHGQMPIYQILRPNSALAAAGLVKTVEEGGRVRLSADSPMVAISSAATINLYLNLEGREPGGVVAAADADEYLRRAARVFADLEVEGRPVVERIFTREEAAEIGLRHPDTGDLVVFLAPGFSTSYELRGALHEPSRYYGQHGFLASHDEMCGMLFARGAGLPTRRIGEVPVTAIAPTIARWLGFELESTDGVVISDSRFR
jgi:predicted AlkP superfamily phosphohydrolase/phosphomutase